MKRYERDGLTLRQALRTVMVGIDNKVGWMARGEAAKVLAIADAERVTQTLLEQFFQQEEKTELWETALALEWLGDKRSVEPLIGALHDSNLHRRHAAARALGWIYQPGSRAVTA